MGTWTLKYTTGYNSNTWSSKTFATYTAGSSNEEITSMSAYFAVAKNGTTYNQSSTVTGDGKACSLTMFSGNSTATVSITATCGRTYSSSGYYYPTWSETVLYTWTFSTPITVAANSTVTIYCKKGSGVLCNGNGGSRKGTVTGVAGVPKRYITYNANGGTGAPSKQECIKGTATKVSSTKPTKASESLTGYKVTFNSNGGNSVSPTSTTSTRTKSFTFSKWNTNSTGTGTSYDSGGSITLTNDITLYAIYSNSTANNVITTPTATRSNGSSKVTITFNGNGGTPTKTSDSSTATITYTAKGWYTATSGGTKRADNGGDYTPTAAETIYQQWDSSLGAYSSITLPGANRTGYIMKGWATSNTATSAAYGVGASYTPSASIILYAIWEADQNTVHYDANGGSGTMTDSTATYGSTFTPKENTFDRYGYDFKEWNESADGNGVSWGSRTWNYTKDITLYAQWTPWSYKVEYNSNGAPTGTMSSSNHKYQDDSTLKKLEYAYPGYNFKGWSNDIDGAVICNDQDLAPYTLVTTPNDTIILYAIWSQDSPWTLAQIKIYDSTNGKWWTC